MDISIMATGKPDRTPGKVTPCGMCGRMRQRGSGDRKFGDYCRDCKRPAREMGWINEGEV